MQKTNKLIILTNVLCTISIVQYAYAAVDVREAILWAYPSNSGTTASYEIEWAGPEYNLPGVSEWSWGRPYIKAVQCEVATGSGPFNQDHYNVVAFPKEVQIIPGFNATISVRGDFDNASVGGWNIAVGYKATDNKNHGVVCATVGSNWDGPYANGSSSGVSQRIKFPLGIPAGSYSIQIPARVGMYTRYWSSNRQPPVMAAASMLNHLISVDSSISVSVKVNNSCEFNTNGFTLDHGAQILGIADKHEVSKAINVSCSGKTSVRLNLVSLSPPNNYVSGEYRAGLGNGWDSRLKLNGTSAPLTLRFSAKGAQTVQVSSELIRGADSDVGKLSGSAVLIMEPN
ncbi:PapG chaperone-binding domain-containing protein [Salmonella enterica]